jgi:DNA-binding CsgD family transcriptional regulator
MEQLISRSKKTILFYQPDRYTKRFNSYEADKYFEEHIPCNFLVATTWDDFVYKLNHNPNLVGFHCDLFDNEELNMPALIKTIETTLKLKNKQADIFVAVNKRANRNTIDILRKTNIIGLQFSWDDFGIEYAAESYRRLLEDRYHWPEDTINNFLEYKENKRPLHVYFRDDLDTYLKFDPELAKKIKEGLDVNIQQCKSWRNLSSSLADQPKNITFHIDMVRRHGGTISEFMMMLDTMIKYADLPIRPNISVGIEVDTHLSTIKELQKHRILGIAPSSRGFGVEYTRAAIKDLINDIPHWPKDIIARLPGNEPKAKNKTSTALTLRQQEVFDLIAKRGLSNKQIARVLNISESTVKIHVSAVMKNLCVRNRTQLALTK